MGLKLGDYTREMVTQYLGGGRGGERVIRREREREREGKREEGSDREGGKYGMEEWLILLTWSSTC